MPRIDNSTEIKATPAAVFQYISDLEALPEWVKWAKRVEVTSLSKQGVGTTDASLMQVGPQKQNVEGLITEYKDGEFYTRRLTRGMELTERLAGAVRHEIGEDAVSERRPVMIGEDFSEYGRAGVPAAIFWVGAVEPARYAEAKESGKPLPSAHSSEFAPDRERTLRTAIRVEVAMLLELLAPSD